MLFLSYDFSGIVSVVIPQRFYLAFFTYLPFVPVKRGFVVRHDDVPLTGDLIKTVRLLLYVKVQTVFLFITVRFQKKVKISAYPWVIVPGQIIAGARLVMTLVIQGSVSYGKHLLKEKPPVSGCKQVKDG